MKYVIWQNYNLNPEDWKEDYKETAEINGWEEDINDRDKLFEYMCETNDMIGYWRKANQIHNWFVENVQDGEDDCGAYEVNEYQLQELLDLCKEVQDIAIIRYGKIENGKQYVNGKWETIYEDGYYIANSEDISNLLPSCEGFFFGGTDYDEYYMNDIKETIEILEQVLKETDFEEEVVFYHASW